MGSEKYPYKGILDHFANRGLAEGTYAWTGQEVTGYAVCTAGERGFLQILPIYIDHILYPTITDAGFITEVRLSHPHADKISHNDRFITLVRRAKTLAWFIARCKGERTVRTTLWPSSQPFF